MLTTKLKDLGSIPGTYMVKERTDSCKLPSDLHTCAVSCMSPYIAAPTHKLKEELHEIFQNSISKVGLVAQGFNPSTQKVKAGRAP